MTDTNTIDTLRSTQRASRRLQQLSAAIEIASTGRRSLIILTNKSTWYEDILAGLRLFTKSTEPDGVLFSLPNGGCIKIQHGLPAVFTPTEVL